MKDNELKSLKIYGSGNPIRLFVAGLHGDEWKETTDLLLNLKPPEKGTLAIIPLVYKGSYVSTLDKNYYKTIGKKILDAINTLNPDIYLELHSYHNKNKEKLTSKNRINETGVFEFIELENKVLFGSVAPFIRRNYFPVEALCTSFEILKSNAKSKKQAEKLLEVFKYCESRKDFMQYLKNNYPNQAKQSIKNYKRFFRID